MIIQLPLLSGGHCGSIVLEVVVGRDLWDPPCPAFHLEQDCDLWCCRSVMALLKLPLKAFKDRDWPAFLGSMFLCSTSHAQSHASRHNSKDLACYFSFWFCHLLLLRRVQPNNLCHFPLSSFALSSDIPLFSSLPGKPSPTYSKSLHKLYAVGHLPSYPPLCMSLSCFLTSFWNWGTPNRTHYPRCGLTTTKQGGIIISIYMLSMLPS